MHSLLKNTSGSQVWNYTLALLLFISGNFSVNAQTRPISGKRAEVKLLDGRIVTLHEIVSEEGGETPKALRYFHTPILAFQYNKDNTFDHPIIWNKKDNNESIFIEIRVVNSNDIFRETLARRAVIEQDLALDYSQPIVPYNKVRVDAWEIKSFTLTAHNALTYQQYGVARSLNLTTSGNILKVSLEIKRELYKSFIEALDEELLLFTPYYTYNGVSVDYVSKYTTVSSDVKTAVSDALVSYQLSEGEPIFQTNSDEIEYIIKDKIFETIFTTQPELISHLTTLDMSNSLFQSESINFTDVQNDNVLLNKVSEYLRPIIDKTTTVEKNNDSTIETQEDEKNKTVNFGIKGKIPEGNITITDREFNKIENTYGISFEKDTESEVYRPHQIKVFRLRKAWQQRLTEGVQRLYVQSDVGEASRRDSDVSATFTESRFLSLLNEDEAGVASALSGIPKGVAVFSFRDDIPRGFVRLDGEALFPSANWVPEHLKGKPVPNMNGKYARGTSSYEQIGDEFLDGNIIIPKIHIDLNKGDTVFYLSAIDNSLGAFDRGYGPLKLYTKSGRRGSYGGEWREYTPFKGSELQLLYDISDRQLQGDFLGREKNETNFRLDDIPEIKPITAYDWRVRGEYSTPAKTVDMSSEDVQLDHVLGQWIMRIY